MRIDTVDAVMDRFGFFGIVMLYTSLMIVLGAFVVLCLIYVWPMIIPPIILGWMIWKVKRDDNE